MTNKQLVISSEKRTNPKRSMDIMTNEQLVIRIQSGEEIAENMAALYEQVKGFIHSIAWKYRDSGELEDLEQEGYLALYPAIDGYDPATGCKFLTYAEYHIRQHIRQYIQLNSSCLHIPVHCTEAIRKYKKFCTQYEQKNGKPPSERTTALFLGLSVEQVRNIRVNACLAHVGSLDAPVTGLDGGEDATLGEMAAGGDLEEEVIEHLESQELKETIWACVGKLEEKQQEVICKHYKEGFSLSEIGRIRGTTPEAVRQIHNKALRSLREPRYSKRLRPFLPETERIYSRAITGNGVESFKRTWTSSTERIALRMQ